MLIQNIAVVKLELLKKFYNYDIISNISGLIMGILGENEKLNYKEQTKSFEIITNINKCDDITRAVYVGLSSYMQANSPTIRKILYDIFNSDYYLDVMNYIIENPNVLIRKEIINSDLNKEDEVVLVLSLI